MREQVTKELYRGGLGRHFGHAKRITLIMERYYWHQLKMDAEKVVHIDILFVKLRKVSGKIQASTPCC